MCSENDTAEEAGVGDPVVTAVVSTFNSAKFMGSCIEDLERQSIAERLEIIVIDSGSQQNEAEIVRDFQRRYANIRYLRTETRESVYSAWNRGIRIAQGRYITNANTDDRHRKDAFERMAAVLDEKPDVALVYADVIRTETENETFESCTPTGRYRWYDWDRNLLLTKGCFIGPQPMWRRSVHDVYGFFDERLVSSGDYEFWLRISQTLAFYHIPEPLGLYLVSPGSIEHRNRDVKLAEDGGILTDYHRAARQGEIIRAVAIEDLGRCIEGQDAPGINGFRRNSFCIAGDTSRTVSPVPTGRSDTGGQEMLPVEQVYEDIQPILQSSRPADALRALQNLVRSFPEFARAHNDLGTLYYRSGEKQKAQGHFERAVKISPGDGAFQKDLADFYFVEMGRAVDAVRLYEEVLKSRPHDVETLTTTAHILVSLKRFEEAAAYYRKVLEIEPWNGAAQENLQKLTKVERGGNGNKSPEDLHAEAKRFLDEGRRVEARSRLEQLLEIHPNDALAHNDLGVLYIHAGEKERALRHYEEAVRLQPDSITFLKNLGDLYFVEQGRIEDAMRVYVRVLEIHPEDIETLMATGHICIALNEPEDARIFFQRVLEIEPWNQEANEQLTRLENRSTGSGPSLSASPPQEIYAEASRMIAAGDILSGKERLERLAGLHPGFPLAHNDLGVLAYQAGEKQKALEHYQKAVELEPANLTFRKNLADCYWVGFGRIQEALKIYVDVLTSHPEDIETLLATGKLCLALRQEDDARVFFGRVLELEPWNADAHEVIERMGSHATAA